MIYNIQLVFIELEGRNGGFIALHQLGGGKADGHANGLSVIFY